MKRCCLLACSACFLVKSGITSPGMAPLTMGWALSHQLLTLRMSLQACPQPDLMEAFSSLRSLLSDDFSSYQHSLISFVHWGPSFQMTSLYQVDIKLSSTPILEGSHSIVHFWKLLLLFCPALIRTPVISLSLSEYSKTLLLPRTAIVITSKTPFAE